MAGFYVALGMIAPFYNLALVVVVIALFVALFRTPARDAYMVPWKLLAVCVGLFVLEEVLTILRNAKVLTFIPQHINAFFELGIIILFIYMVLLQKEHIKIHYSHHHEKIEVEEV